MNAKTIMLGKRNQVTLPQELIPEGTELFHAERLGNGNLLLIPQASIPASQIYFWSRRWQEGERQASQDIQAGKLHPHHSTRDLFSYLDKRHKR